VDQYQNVSILNFIGSKDDVGGDDNWAITCAKPQVKSTTQTNIQLFYRLEAAECPSTEGISETSRDEFGGIAARAVGMLAQFVHVFI